MREVSPMTSVETTVSFLEESIVTDFETFNPSGPVTLVGTPRALSCAVVVCVVTLLSGNLLEPV